MTRKHSVLYVARVVLEAATPLSVSTGTPDNVFDTALVRDANGLPAIPGTSLAGVLRHLWIDTHGENSVDDLFGHQRGRTGLPSRVTVSWGALLDSQGSPAEGLLLGKESKRLEDPFYAAALAQIDAPVFRNRVRLTHRGAAAHRGKFDRAVLPAGNRFAVELRLWAKDGDDGTQWRNLLDLLGHPGFRLGGATRAGLGRIRCVSVHQRRFDLCDPEQTTAFRSLGRGLAEVVGLESYVPYEEDFGWLRGTLMLKARGLWRIGQGDVPLDEKVDKPADLLPVVEGSIRLTDSAGTRTSTMLLIPAASVKGTLAHRMAFHANRHAHRWADQIEPGDKELAKPPAVQALLGDVKEGNDGRAGCLFIDDGFLPTDAATVTRLMHNAIDRFTGGVRDRVLYEEESLLGGELNIELALDCRRLRGKGNEDDARRAFKAALDDLCQGRLALGSRTTTGNGFFTGALAGSLADWLNGTSDAQREAV